MKNTHHPFLINTNSLYKKIIQGSYVIKYNKLISRETNDIDILIIPTNNYDLDFIHTEIIKEINLIKSIKYDFNSNLFIKFTDISLGKKIEIILAKFLPKNTYKKINNKINMVRPEYTLLAKIFQISSLLSDDYLTNDKFNLNKLNNSITDLQVLLKNKLLVNKTKKFIFKYLTKILINNFIFDFFYKNKVDFLLYSQNIHKLKILNILSKSKNLSDEIIHLFNLSRIKKEKLQNLIILNDYILRNKLVIFEQINKLNDTNQVLKNNVVWLKNIKNFFDHFKKLNIKKIEFKSKYNFFWNREYIEISPAFSNKKYLNEIGLKYKFNNNLKDNEIVVYKNKQSQYLLNTLYKLLVFLVFI
ncbi:hypothetical protein RRG40_04560 [Mycoplasmopsis felis]|uniref:hypothetical protein n=1 Tax=Mycoplasmopsis felis TaxID=33923 RepID=UPI002AFF8180|nr:hypothetical protein [Mycoplasmopsis felis]WQQ05461.1 hypothetical protein RRG59_03880 [Mycoplasmopsis felis]